MKNPDCKYLEILRTEEVQEAGHCVVSRGTVPEVKKPHLFLSNKVRLLPVTGLGFRLYFLAGSSGFLSLPSMYGLHGLAFTGPGVFHTTLN